METLRRENARLRQELEKEKARAAELGAQNGQPAPKAQEDPDLEKLRLLASQIKSRMEEARQMEQAARRESERIIAAARLEGQTIPNKAKEAGNEGESALGRQRQELDREAAQILKEKSAAQDLLAQAQEDADVLRATARREQEEILENARRQSAEILQKPGRKRRRSSGRRRRKKYGKWNRCAMKCLKPNGSWAVWRAGLGICRRSWNVSAFFWRSKMRLPPIEKRNHRGKDGGRFCWNQTGSLPTDSCLFCAQQEER